MIQQSVVANVALPAPAPQPQIAYQPQAQVALPVPAPQLQIAQAQVEIEEEEEDQPQEEDGENGLNPSGRRIVLTILTPEVIKNYSNTLSVILSYSVIKLILNYHTNITKI